AVLRRTRRSWNSSACRSRKSSCTDNSKRRNRVMRYITLLLAVAIAVAPFAISAQTRGAARPWTPPKTPWGDPDIQGLWPGQDMVGTPLERDRSFGTRAELTDEEFSKRVTFSEEQKE